MLRGEWHDVTWADLVRGWAGESLWIKKEFRSYPKKHEESLMRLMCGVM